MISSILVIPGCGWADAGGAWAPGFARGRLREVDLVDAIVHDLVAELETARLRTRVLSTRKHPGLTPDQRFEAIEPGMVVLSIGIAMREQESRRQYGTVFYGHDAARPLANLVTESLRLWGRGHKKGCYVARKPKQHVEPTLTIPETVSVHVEPMDLAAAGADTLASRLPACGRSLGWAIQEFLRGRAHSVGCGPLYRGLAVRG